MKHPEGTARLASAETLVRAGQAGQAARLLDFSVSELKKLQTIELAKAAALIKRTGRPFDALKALAPRLRSNRDSVVGDSRLWLEHADCLTHLGAAEGATRILKQPRVLALAKSHLYLGMAAMRTWDYVRGEESFDDFLRLTGESNHADYDRWIAQVNRCACLVAQSRSDEAADTLKFLRPELAARGFARLLANAWELTAQIAIKRRAPQQAELALHEVERLSLAWNGAIDSLYIEKWRALALLARRRAQGLAAIIELRAHCTDAARAEMARDLDCRIAEATDDQVLMRKVWFGTPHEAFRKAMPTPLKGDYQIIFARAKKARSKRAARLEDWLLGGQGKLTRRLFSATLLDLYRAPNVVELFERAYPDARFNAESSPLALHQAMHRMRAQMREARCEVEVTFANGTYGVAAPLLAHSMRISEPFWRTLRLSPASLDLKRALPKLAHDGFKTADFAVALNQSLRHAQMSLKELVTTGAVAKAGSARASIYRMRLPVNKIAQKM